MAHLEPHEVDVRHDALPGAVQVDDDLVEQRRSAAKDLSSVRGEGNGR